MKMLQIPIQFQQFHRSEFARIVIAQLRSIIQIHDHMNMLGQWLLRQLHIKFAFHPHVGDEIQIIHLKDQIFPAP